MDFSKKVAKSCFWAILGYKRRNQIFRESRTLSFLSVYDPLTMCYIMNCESLKSKSNYFLTCKYFQLILQPLQTFRLLVLLVFLLLFHSIRQFGQCNSCHCWRLYGKLYTLKTKMISGLIKL